MFEISVNRIHAIGKIEGVHSKAISRWFTHSQREDARCTVVGRNYAPPSLLSWINGSKSRDEYRQNSKAAGSSLVSRSSVSPLRQKHTRATHAWANYTLVQFRPLSSGCQLDDTRAARVAVRRVYGRLQAMTGN
jgi:hypothetical protein